MKPVKPVMHKMYRNGNFTTTTNNKFAIRPLADKEDDEPDANTYSPDLYIKNDVVLDESSPLVKLMKMGLIVESSTEFTKKNYTAYQFFRPLLDTINYDKEGKYCQLHTRIHIIDVQPSLFFLFLCHVVWLGP